MYLACQEQRRPETIRDKRYVFVHVPEQRFFGFEEIAVLGHAVQMATTERALLDAIDRPRHAGGIGEVSRIELGSRRKWSTTGKLVRPWNVVENVPREVLISREDKPRRRVAFVKKGQNR